MSIFKYTLNLFSLRLHGQYNLFLILMQMYLYLYTTQLTIFTNGIGYTRVLVESGLKIFKDKNSLIIIIIII